jgi:uncharacterized membrane protein
MIQSGNRSRSGLAGLAALSVLAVGLLVVRKHVAPYADHYRFLLWNLVLAWIPMVCALGAFELHRGGRARSAVAALGVVWLAFLPNAPYLMTDFVHRHDQPGVPLWYDTLLFGAFGLSGLMLGVASLALIHSLLRRAVSGAVAWVSVGAVVVLTSVGILLGRILRWNSWEVVTNPGRLVGDLRGRSLNPLEHGRVLGWTLAFVMVIGATYVLVDRLLNASVRNRHPS